MTERPRLVGINHVALEVGDLDEALAFYSRIFDFTLRDRLPAMAFVEMGDQFIALAQGRSQPPDSGRHFGLVVDSKEATRRALQDNGVEIVQGRGLNFRDPWGNRIEIVEYGDVQFTKGAGILAGMELSDLQKSQAALEELERKGLRPG
jgi:predicted enzyme related to lactoylglutathione lyase